MHTSMSKINNNNQAFFPFINLIITFSFYTAMIIIQEKTVSWATAAIGLAITVHTSTLMTLRRAKFAICRVNLLLSLYFHKQAYINFHIMENVTENICGM